MLRKRRVAWSLGVLALVLITVAFVLLVYLKVRDLSFANQGQLLFVFPVALYWFWLLRQAPQRWQQLNHALQEGRVAHVTGPLQVDFHIGFGIFQSIQYYVYIGEYRFRVSQSIFRRVRPGANYDVYYVAQLGWFLGAHLREEGVERADGMFAAGLVGEGAGQNGMASTLTMREREVLSLLASGLTSQEMAVHLSLSVNSIEMYTRQLYRKLGVTRRKEALMRAREMAML